MVETERMVGRTGGASPSKVGYGLIMTVSDLEIFRAAHLHLNRPGAPFGAAASQKPATPWGVHLVTAGDAARDGVDLGDMEPTHRISVADPVLQLRPARNSAPSRVDDPGGREPRPGRDTISWQLPCDWPWNNTGSTPFTPPTAHHQH